MNRFNPMFLAGLLAFVGTPAILLAQQPRLRRAAEPRPGWTEEQIGRPQVERTTHRGFEVSQGPILVIAKTSMSDARQVAEQALTGWQEMAQLAERFDGAARRSPLARASLQIAVDVEPPPARLGMPASGNVVGQTTQMAIQLGPWQPSTGAPQQLRFGAARAYLHAAALDRQLPPWVCEGLAAYVGGIGAGDDDDSAHRLKPYHSPSQQRLADAVQHPSEVDGTEHPEAAQLVRFLLEGDDARHAGTWMQLLAAQVARGRSQPDEQTLRELTAASAQSQALEQFAQQLAPDFEQWKVNPQIGQPVLDSGESSDEAMRREQKELLFALKLLDRFGRSESAAIRTRVTTFDKGQRGAIVLTGTSGAKPPPVRALVEQRTAYDQQPWATVGPDGTLIWSTDADRLRAILGVEENRYEHVWHGDRWVLQTSLADGRQLVGWLEANPQEPRRPLGKISVQAAR